MNIKALTKLLTYMCLNMYMLSVALTYIFVNCFGFLFIIIFVIDKYVTHQNVNLYVRSKHFNS